MITNLMANEHGDKWTVKIRVKYMIDYSRPTQNILKIREIS